MSIKPRTIDDLGIEASNQYAKGQVEFELERRLLEESKLFPRTQPGAGVTPYLPVLYDIRFVIGPMIIWAGFNPPANYATVSSHLFTYQLIPSMGGSDQLQGLSDKIEGLEKTVPADKKSQYEYKTVQSLLKLLVDSTRTFELIKSRCNQYQRG